MLTNQLLKYFVCQFILQGKQLWNGQKITGVTDQHLALLSLAIVYI
jgi:hypothetical protein